MHKHDTLKMLQEIAINRGGKLLSTEYINSKTPMTWECSIGHIWQAISNAIKDQKTWCPHCNGTNRLTISELQELAVSRGGKLLSTDYISAQKKLLWQCADNHTWFATTDSIKYAGSWCPHCLASHGENLLRLCVEQIFQEEFPKKRPEWLVNDDGNRLELDGFCEVLSLAFEYNGEQHYNATNLIGQAKVEKTQKHDEIKRRICSDRGVRIITISELEIKKYTNIKEYIKIVCDQEHISLPDNFDIIKINFDRKYVNHELEACKRIAIERDGVCLSTGYYGQSVPLEFRCNKCDIMFEAKPINLIHKNFWCPHCKTARKGEKNANSKITEKDVVEIRHLLNGGATQKFVAEKYGITKENVSSIKNRRSWKHIP